MATTIKCRQLVKPAGPTWNGILPLTELDQIGEITHNTPMYIYNNPNPNNNNLQNSSHKNNATIKILKDSLVRALVPFYPLAGRLQRIGDGGRLELNCNAMGVEVIEAESSKEIKSFGDFSSYHVFDGLVPCLDYAKPIDELPLVSVQLTSLQCGGFCIAIAISHVVGDASAQCDFLRQWAKLARGESSISSPYLDRQLLIIKEANNDDHDHNHDHNPTIEDDVADFSRLPILIGQKDSSEEQRKKTCAANLVLSKEQVSTLLRTANFNYLNENPKRRRFSRFEVIASHVWRCACKARGHQPQQLTAMCYPVDSRTRLNPPLPQRYFGNAALDLVVFGQAGELNCAPLSQICGKIRAQTNKVTDDYIWSTIKFFSAQKSVYKYQNQQDNVVGGPSCEGIFYGNPNLEVACIMNIPFRGIDFGWGKEVYMGIAMDQECDGCIIILPGYDGDGSVVVAICLQVQYMETFKKCLYDDIGHDILTSARL